MAKSITVTLKLDDKNFSKGVKDADGALGGLDRSGQSASTSMGSLLSRFAPLAAAAGAVYAAIKTLGAAIDQVKEASAAAASVEQLGVRLEVLTGSAEMGARAMEMVVEQAAKLPYSLDEIAQGSPALLLIADQVGGLDNAIQLAAGTASSFGIDFQTAAGQLQRALTSGAQSADIFRERGVNAFLGFEQGVTYTAEQTAEAFNKSFDRITAGTSKMAETLDGKMSMVGDSIFKVQVAFGSVFNEALKATIDSLTSAFGANEEAVTSFAREAAFTLVEALLAAGKTMAFVIDNVVEIARTLKAIFGPAFEAAGKIGVWFGNIMTKSLGFIIDRVYALGEVFTNFLEYIGILEQGNAVAEYFRQGQIAAGNLAEGMSGIPGFFDQIGESSGRVTAASDAFADIETRVRAAMNTMRENQAATEAQTAATQAQTEAITVNVAEAVRGAEKLSEAEKTRQREIERTTEKIIDNGIAARESITAYTDARILEFNQVQENIDLYGVERDVIEELIDFDQKRAEGIAKLQETIAEAERLHREENSATTATLVENAQTALDNFMELSAQERAELEERTREYSESQRSFSTGWRQAHADYKDQITDMSRYGKQVFTDLTTSLTDSFRTFAETGKISFKGVVDTLKKAIIDYLASAAARGLIDWFDKVIRKANDAKKASDGLGGVLSKLTGGSGGFLGKAISFGAKLFGFAEGGYIPGNKLSIVGEKGPELFMPSSSGTIIPNFALGQNGLGGGGATVINYNISAVDSDSFKNLIAKDPEFIYNVTMAGSRRIPR